jgi:hypothetical protein
MASGTVTARDGHIYYVFQSALQPSIYKLGITADLDRRWREHGGEAKHKLIYSGELGIGIAYQVERQIKQKFHHLRITDGNELFCLSESELAKVIKMARFHEIASYQIRKAKAQQRAQDTAKAKAEARAKAQAEIQRRSLLKAKFKAETRAKAAVEAEALADQAREKSEALAAKKQADAALLAYELGRIVNHPEVEDHPPEDAVVTKSSTTRTTVGLLRLAVAALATVTFFLLIAK